MIETGEQKMRTILITGANSGIGKAAAYQFAKKGEQVIMVCRNQLHAAEVRTKIIEETHNHNIHLFICDLAIIQAVKKLVDQLTNTYEVIDVVINNAADFDISRKKVEITVEGREKQFATNVVAPYYLSRGLIPLVKKSQNGKIINISSQGLSLFPFMQLNVRDLNAQKHYRPSKQYYQNKLALLMLTDYFARTNEEDIHFYAIRVPNVKVDISRYPKLSKMAKSMYKIKSKFALSVEEMAKVYVELALSDSQYPLYINEKFKAVKINRGARNQERSKVLVSYLNSLA